MKKINFTKMSGSGNDFIMIDAQKGLNYKSFTKKVCDRTNGIGADGVIILDKSKKKQDYKMRIINADGSEAEMCGNGARCFAAYVVKNRKPNKKLFSFETLAGEILGEATGENAIVRLSDPIDYKPSVPLTIAKRRIHVSSIDTGVPHAVIFVDNLDHIDVSKIGSAIRYHIKFKPRGTNVNFAEQINSKLVRARTYERGVEDETKACGTGSVAVAIITYLKANPTIKNKKKAKMNVQTQGKEILKVTFDLINGEVSNVWLQGSAHFICQGNYYF